MSSDSERDLAHGRWKRDVASRVLNDVRNVSRIMLSAALVISVAALNSCGGEEGGTEAVQPSTTTVTSEPFAPTTVASPSGRPPTKQDIVGTWAAVGEALQWRFTSNGHFAFDRFNLNAPFASGTWKLRGRTIELVALGAGCLDDWEWRAGIEKGKDRRDDELEVVFLREGCDRIAGTRFTLVRIEG
jgi:hypothetical protein